MRDDRIDLAEGVFVVLNYLSHDVIDELRNIIVEGLSEVAEKTKCSMVDIERLCSAWNQDCIFVQSCIERLKPYLSALLDIHCLSDRYTFSGTTLFVNSWHHKIGTHAHQDLSYRYKSDEPYALSTWVPLNNVGPSSGALIFCDMPRNPLTVRQDFLHPDFNNLIDTMSDDEWNVACANQGDILIFDSTVWHASKPCRMEKTRYALAFRWHSKSRWETKISIPTPEYKSNEFGMDTSGDLLKSVILEYMCINGVEHEPQTLDGYVDWLLKQSEDSFLLGESEKECLSDLHQALMLNKCGGRIAADVWIQVRDNFVLPRLSSRY